MKKTYRVELVQYYYAVGCVEVEAESEDEAAALAEVYSEEDVDWSPYCPEDAPIVVDMEVVDYDGVSA